jgi:hypothetical protein
MLQTDIHLVLYFAQFFLELEMLQINFVEEVKTHILCSVTFFPPKNRAVCEIMWEYCGAGRATDGNMAHAHFMLDK